MQKVNVMDPGRGGEAGAGVEEAAGGLVPYRAGKSDQCMQHRYVAGKRATTNHLPMQRLPNRAISGAIAD